MAEPLKDMYSAIWLKQWYLYQAHIWEVNNWKINEIEHWIQRFQTTNWEEAALLDRVRLLATALQEDFTKVLDNDTSNQEFNFRIAAEVVCQISNHIREYERTLGFHWIFLPQWVANFGLENLQISMEALGVITQLVSAEFAVRPFLLQDQEACKPYFEKWSQSENNAVRRLASEGCRPRLPWGKALSALEAQPEWNFQLLETLLYDPSEYVRKSVANHLNDLSKVWPNKVIELAQRHLRKPKNKPNTATYKLLKHALRTLLKQGHQEALLLFGFQEVRVEIVQIKGLEPVYNYGEKLEIEVSCKVLENTASNQALRVEAVLGYQKANHSISDKVFQVGNKQPSEDGIFQFSFSKLLADYTTRKHYAGRHQVAILINGKEIQRIDFELVK